MLFITIGLITLFASFLIALVILIRELGQRANLDDRTDDYFLDLAPEVIRLDSNSSDSSSVKREITTGFLPKDITSDTARLDEVVPFPWEMEVETQSSQAEGENPRQADTVSNEPVQVLSRDSLYGEISLSDLANKD